MSIIAWIVLGAIAGYLAGLLVKGDEGLGVIGHIVLGIVGASDDPVDPRIVDGTAWITGADAPGKHVMHLVAGRERLRAALDRDNAQLAVAKTGDLMSASVSASEDAGFNAGLQDTATLVVAPSTDPIEMTKTVSGTVPDSVAAMTKCSFGRVARWAADLACISLRLLFAAGSKSSSRPSSRRWPGSRRPAGWTACRSCARCEGSRNRRTTSSTGKSAARSPSGSRASVGHHPCRARACTRPDECSHHFVQRCRRI